MKHFTNELTKSDYTILQYLSSHTSSTEKDIISALNDTVDGIKYRLEKLSTKEVHQRANGTTYSTEAYISRMNRFDSPIYAITSKGEAELQDYNTKKKSDKKELWLKNAWIPIIVSFVTTNITVHLIPKLPLIQQWLSNIQK